MRPYFGVMLEVIVGNTQEVTEEGSQHLYQIQQWLENDVTTAYLLRTNCATPISLVPHQHFTQLALPTVTREQRYKPWMALAMPTSKAVLHSVVRRSSGTSTPVPTAALWVVIRCEPTDWTVIRSKELSLLGRCDRDQREHRC